MPSIKHQNKLKEIKDSFEREGWICKEQVSVIRENGKIIENSNGLIDLCCQKRQNLNCFEIENGAQQALKNSRDLEKMGQIARQKRLNYRKCQLGSQEEWRKVCK
jgi:hypothetical protein